MDTEKYIDLIPSTVVLFILLIIAISIMRLTFGQPFWLAELGIALIIAVIYPRIAKRLGIAPKSWES